jgi:hypothetical protein
MRVGGNGASTVRMREPTATTTAISKTLFSTMPR